MADDALGTVSRALPLLESVLRTCDNIAGDRKAAEEASQGLRELTARQTTTPSSPDIEVEQLLKLLYHSVAAANAVTFLCYSQPQQKRISWPAKEQAHKRVVRESHVTGDQARQRLQEFDAAFGRLDDLHKKLKCAFSVVEKRNQLRHQILSINPEPPLFKIPYDFRDPRVGEAVPERKSRGPWVPQRVLCLDGSGLRGMSSLFVLDHLMTLVSDAELVMRPSADSSAASPLYLSSSATAVDKHDRYRPCHYFDFVCGSGLGGMSAVMLGSMRLSVREVIKRSTLIMGDVPPSGLSRSRSLLRTARTIARRSEQASLPIKTLQQQLEADSETDNHKSGERHAVPTLEADADTCQTVCITAIKARRTAAMPYKLRSYRLPDYLHHLRPDPKLAAVETASRDTRFSIVDACLASVAPPLSPQRPKVDGFSRRLRFVASVDIDPASEAYKELGIFHNTETPNVEQMLYINCEEMDSSSSRDRKTQNLKILQTELADSFHHFDLTEDKFATVPERNRGTDFGHGTSTNLGALRERAQKFCVEHEEELQRCAKELVDARRRRAKTIEWGRFASLRVSSGPRVYYSRSRKPAHDA